MRLRAPGRRPKLGSRYRAAATITADYDAQSAVELIQCHLIASIPKDTFMMIEVRQTEIFARWLANLRDGSSARPDQRPNSSTFDR